MSLQGIFDPVVRAYYEKKFGGGNAVDDGYYIEWDGNTEGRDVIELDAGGGYVIRYYKVSNLIIEAERLEGATHKNSAGNYFHSGVVPLDGLSIIVNGGQPLGFSGKAGEYSYSGFTATLPSDGTYLEWDTWNICNLYRPATE